MDQLALAGMGTSDSPAVPRPQTERAWCWRGVLPQWRGMLGGLWLFHVDSEAAPYGQPAFQVCDLKQLSLPDVPMLVTSAEGGTPFCGFRCSGRLHPYMSLMHPDSDDQDFVLLWLDSLLVVGTWSTDY